VKTIPNAFCFSWVALLSSAFPAGGLFAQNAATTGTVGAISFSAAAHSDTIVSLPLQRAHSFRGVIASATGSELTLEQASFADDAFNDRFYLIVESGAGEGRWFPVADTSGATVTLDPGADGTPAFFTPGTVVRIIPFWTLDSVFPDGRGVNASGSLLPVSRVLLPDTTRAGVRLAPAASFFYFAGNEHGGEGWRKFGASPTVKFDGQILPPGASLVVRHESGSGTLFENLGVVPAAAFSSRLATVSPDTAQDHALGLGVPVALSLSESRLFESGAFAGSGTLDAPVDELLVFDQSAPAKNRTPSGIYYYYTGSQNGGPGWRLKGDLNTVRNLAQVFQPARGFVIRKAAGPVPASSHWTVRPAYLDLP
jgi:uncharacterized protein (TIGR02597 family)